jgi:hypothetical protein
MVIVSSPARQPDLAPHPPKGADGQKDRKVRSILTITIITHNLTVRET